MQEMSLIINELNSKSVGIWAGSLCAIDYGTLGQVKHICFQAKFVALKCEPT